MKKAAFVITVWIDEARVSLDAQRYRRTPERQLSDLIAACDARLVDSLRWHDGIARVDSEVLVEPLEAPGVTVTRRWA